MSTDNKASSSARRGNQRSNLEMRPVRFTLGINDYADGSVLVEFGKTKVICTATVEKNLPQWLVGGKKGWVTAEYAMLPTATHSRNRRERDKMGGRTHEIQRLVGRSLRAVVDLKKIPERSVIVDCDVILADGGTRTASITGGFVALALALRKHGLTDALTGQVAAVSVGMKEGQVFVDLDYNEDSSCDVDMNFVMTDAGHFVEVQGTGEGRVFSREDMNAMTDAAQDVLAKLLVAQKQALGTS